MAKRGKASGAGEASVPPALSASERETVDASVASLSGLNLDQLRLQWRNQLGGIAPAHLPGWLLIRVLAYRTQAAAFGDLDRTILRRLRDDALESGDARPFAPRGGRRRLVSRERLRQALNAAARGSSGAAFYPIAQINWRQKILTSHRPRVPPSSTVVSYAARPTASRSSFVPHVVHVVGRGPSPFLAHVGAMAHLTFVRPCWGSSGCSARRRSGRLVALRNSG